MSVITHSYRQCFRVYDPRSMNFSAESSSGFDLVVAAPSRTSLVEYALGQLAYGQTGIAVSWSDVVSVTGGRHAPAYGQAEVILDAEEALPRLASRIAAQEASGQAAFILMRLSPYTEDFGTVLKRADQLSDALEKISSSHFIINIARSTAPPLLLLLCFSLTK